MATDDLGELVDAAALLATQPLPDGPRVGVVSNAGGAGVLAADACADAGLTVPVLAPGTQGRLAELLPSGAAPANPVDTTAAVSADAFRQALDAVAGDASVDAVLALVVPTALGDLRGALAGSGTPLAAVVLGQPESVTINAGGVPCYGYPENAVRAVAHAWSHARVRDVPAGTPPALPDLRPDEVAGITGGFLAESPDGGWLPPDRAFRLLASYGLPLAPWRWARSADEAAAAARGLGVPVALKAHVPGIVHKTAAGALQLDLHWEKDVRDAYRRLAARFGDRLAGVVVQAMADEGVEVLCGAVQEEVFGAVVIFGAGGIDTDALADRSARLAPLTVREADELIREPRLAALLLGHPARPAGDVGALRDALLRLSRLVADHPEIAEIDLNPTIVRPDAVVAVDARVRVAPHRAWDPYLRRLR